jgi:hypothetical protein
MRIISEEEIKEIKFLIDTRQLLKVKQKIYNLKKLEENKENEEKKED